MPGTIQGAGLRGLAAKLAWIFGMVIGMLLVATLSHV
jgi:hypothetical protein